MRYLDDSFGWYSPDISKLPGGGTFEDLTRGLGGYVLVALVLAVLLAFASWMIGVASGNIQLAERGKQATIAAFLIALLVGAAPKLLQFFFGAGQGLH